MYRRADDVEIGGQRRTGRREEARIGRIGIGTADQLHLDDVVRRRHACVARMELAFEAFFLERPMQGVDAVGDEERRSLAALREEIAHGPVERSRHPDGDAVAGHERERTGDCPHARRIGGRHAASRLLEVEIVQPVERRIDQVDDAFNRVVHDRLQATGFRLQASGRT